MSPVSLTPPDPSGRTVRARQRREAAIAAARARDAAAAKAAREAAAASDEPLRLGQVPPPKPPLVRRHPRPVFPHLAARRARYDRQPVGEQAPEPAAPTDGG